MNSSTTHQMTPRLNAFKSAPEAMQALSALGSYVKNCGLEASLLELVKLRASQLNGCAYCIYTHSHDARAQGETEARVYMLDAWRESPLYSDRERAALEWTEAVTLIASSRADDAVYAEVQRHFTEPEIVKLTLAIGNINVWNRFGVAMRNVHPVGASDRHPTHT